MLAAIHIAERRIWAAARERAQEGAIPPWQVLDARELYDDWAESVRTRLIVAHRRALADARSTGHDRPGQLLRRLLDGGSAAALAAAEAGLRAGAVLVVVAPEASGRGAADVVAALRRVGIGGIEDAMVVGVVPQLGEEVRAALADRVAGVAGPGAVEEIPALRRLAAAAADVAAAQGRVGPTEVADVAVRIALDGRGDLLGALEDRHRAALDALGRTGPTVARTTRAWLEAGLDAQAAAADLFVHPNTVRNRVTAMTAATGLDPRYPFEALTLWWLCQVAGEPSAEPAG